MMREELRFHNQEYQYLHFVEFRDLGFWDVKKYTSNIIAKIDGYQSLEDVLEEIRIPINHERAKEEGLQIISKINFGGEIFLREFEEIKTYKGSLYLVPLNSIIFSKINARHGCIYYNDSKPFVVSSEYPVFKIDDSKACGKYLHYALRLQKVKDHLTSKITGISKPRLKKEEFLKLPIPIQSKENQIKIVSNCNQKLLDSEAKEQKASQLEKSIGEYLIEELGIELPKTALQQSGFLKLTDFKDLSRWDVWALGKSGSSKKYDNLPFKDVVIGKPMYGANTKTLKQKTDVRYIRITDINEDGSLEQEIVSPLKFEEKYLLQENDFLIARSGNTVGKTFLYKKNFGRCCFAGYLVKYKIDEQKILPEFLLYYTKSKIFKNWINSNQRVAGQPNINGQEYLIFPVVLPPLEIQNKIATKITSIKEEIKTLRQEAQNLKTQAKTEFEKEVFN